MSKKKYAVSDDVLINAINTFPISKLMPAAKLVCSTDYAVSFYNNKRHPQFYHNQEAFRHALRRCVAFNAFNHKETLIRMLDLEQDEN